MMVFIVVRIVVSSSTNAESASVDKSIFFTKILCDRMVAQSRYIRNQWQVLWEISSYARSVERHHFIV